VRRAVLEALSESGFVPLDGEHIGFVTADWPPPGDPSEAHSIERALLLPWEECIARDPAHARPENTRWLTVLWLPAASFSPNPLSRFAYVVDKLAKNIRGKIDIKFIGPANSTGLQSMVREVRQSSGGLPQNVKDTLNRISVFSPRATASDEWLLFRPTSGARTADSGTASTKETVQDLLEGAAPGLTFVRTIAPDDLVVERLVAELARRRVPVVQQTTLTEGRFPRSRIP
jgi:hypothetical protein